MEPAPDECAAVQRVVEPREPFWHYRSIRSVVVKTAVRAWDHSIVSKSASAAFWQTLSLPPLLLALLGSIGYVSSLFGPNTVAMVTERILAFSNATFNPSVVEQIIAPTVEDVLLRGRADIVSAGFLMSLWAGSAAVSTFVDAIVEAHGQKDARNPVWQRFYAMFLYIGFLIAAVFLLPIIAVGPALLVQAVPHSWDHWVPAVIDGSYYPVVYVLLIASLTTLYKFALHHSLPWHRLLAGSFVAGLGFIIASKVLRIYLAWSAENGFSYGALATPVAFLLFAFFLGFAIILGASFNATIQEFWPARPTKIEQMRDWVVEQVTESATVAAAIEPLKGATGRMRAVVRGEADGIEPETG